MLLDSFGQPVRRPNSFIRTEWLFDELNRIAASQLAGMRLMAPCVVLTDERGLMPLFYKPITTYDKVQIRYFGSKEMVGTHRGWFISVEPNQWHACESFDDAIKRMDRWLAHRRR